MYEQRVGKDKLSRKFVLLSFSRPDEYVYVACLSEQVYRVFVLLLSRLERSDTTLHASHQKMERVLQERGSATRRNCRCIIAIHRPDRSSGYHKVSIRGINEPHSSAASCGNERGQTVRNVS